MRKILSLLICAIFLIGLTTGCSKTSDTTEDNTEVTGTKDNNEKDNKDQKVTLTINHHMGEETKRNALNILLKEYEKINPNVQFEVEAIAGSSFDDTLKLRIATDDAPDIVFGRAKEYTDLIRSGNFYDFTDEEFVNNIDEAIIPACTVDGKVYSMPLDMQAMGVFYDKAIFSDAGLEVPTTWDEFINVCETLQAKGMTPISAGFLDAWTLRVVYQPDMFSSVLPYHATFRADLMEGKIKFSNLPEFQGVTERLRKMVSYCADDAFSLDLGKSYSNFASGKSAMLIQGNWAIPSIRKINQDGSYGFFTLPSSNDPDKNLLCVSADDSFLISSTSKHKDEAVEFFEFLSSKEAAKIWCENANQISVIKGASKENLDEMLVDILDIVDTGLTYNLEAESRFNGQYASKFFENMEEFVLKPEISFEDLVSNLESEYEKINNMGN